MATIGEGFKFALPDYFRKIRQKFSAKNIFRKVGLAKLSPPKNSHFYLNKRYFLALYDPLITLFYAQIFLVGEIFWGQIGGLSCQFFKQKTPQRGEHIPLAEKYRF